MQLAEVDDENERVMLEEVFVHIFEPDIKLQVIVKLQDEV